MKGAQSTFTLGNSEYQRCAQACIDKVTNRVKTRLRKIADKPPHKDAVCLVFAISWNAIHELSVCVAPERSDYQFVSLSAPYGDLLQFDAPETERDKPKGYASDKPVVARYLLERLAEWWAEVREQAYPIPVYGSFEGDTSIYNFASKEWTQDPRRIAREPFERAYRQLVQQRMEMFGPLLQKRLERAIEKVGEGPYEFMVMIFHDDDFQVMYNLRCGKKAAHGCLYPPYSELVKILNRDPYVEQSTPFIEKGIDVGSIYRQEHELCLSKLWNSLVPSSQSTSATLEYHDEGAVLDLGQGRWVTDFLGRSLDD
jgi:hypothetical protein